ncbi:hypothetical protein [Sphingobacterium thalpophilum]|nr:hypothetical protein [Sphingobacterium thalpophilum]
MVKGHFACITSETPKAAQINRALLSLRYWFTFRIKRALHRAILHRVYGQGSGKKYTYRVTETKGAG